MTFFLTLNIDLFSASIIVVVAKIIKLIKSEIAYLKFWIKKEINSRVFRKKSNFAQQFVFCFIY